MKCVLFKLRLEVFQESHFKSVCTHFNILIFSILVLYIFMYTQCTDFSCEIKHVFICVDVSVLICRDCTTNEWQNNELSLGKKGTKSKSN